jgi:hypothetical protein
MLYYMQTQLLALSFLYRELTKLPLSAYLEKLSVMYWYASCIDSD